MREESIRFGLHEIKSAMSKTWYRVYVVYLVRYRTKVSAIGDARTLAINAQNPKSGRIRYAPI